MRANISTHSDQPDIDPFILYAQSLHDYSLRLWTESRRVADGRRWWLRDCEGRFSGTAGRLSCGAAAALRSCEPVRRGPGIDGRRSGA